jgi:hypothetical protein
MVDIEGMFDSDTMRRRKMRGKADGKTDKDYRGVKAGSTTEKK